MVRTKKKTKVQDLSHDTVPASVGLVKEVRNELKADIQSVRHELIATRHELNSKIELVNSKVELVLVSVHRNQVLMEEQRTENKIVLDGLKSVMDRQDRMEANH